MHRQKGNSNSVRSLVMNTDKAAVDCQQSLLIMCNLYHFDVIYAVMSYVKMGETVIKLYFMRPMLYK